MARHFHLLTPGGRRDRRRRSGEQEAGLARLKHEKVVVPRDDERPRRCSAQLREHLTEGHAALGEEVQRGALPRSDARRPDERDERLAGHERDPERAAGRLVGEDTVEVKVAVVEALLQGGRAREHLQPRAAARAHKLVELGAAAARRDAAGVLSLCGWVGGREQGE